MTILIDTVVKGWGGHCSNHKRFRTVLFDTVVKADFSLALTDDSHVTIGGYLTIHML